MKQGFKVVEKNTRNGTNWTMLKNRKTAWENEKEKYKFKQKYKQFFPRYLAKSIIKMVPNSPGLMIFEYIELAEEFILDYKYETYELIIIDVFFKEEDILPKSEIIAGCGMYPSIFCDYINCLNINRYYLTPPAEGTLFVKELIIL